MARSDMVSRRILMKRNACNDWTFQLSWSGSRSKCDKACSEYIEMIGEKCIKDESSNEGSLDVGCGTYNFKVKASSKTTATKSVSSTSGKTSHKPTTTTNITKSTSSASKKMSNSPPRTLSSRTEATPKPIPTRSKASFLTSTPLAATEVTSKSLSTQSKANLLTSTPLATTESPSPTPTDGAQRPLELRPVVCEDEASLPGHAPINAKNQRILSGVACYDIVFRDRITSLDSKNKALTHNIKFHGTNYFYSISWVDGCKTTVDSQGTSAPLGESGPVCRDLFIRAYTECKFLISASTEPD